VVNHRGVGPAAAEGVGGAAPGDPAGGVDRQRPARDDLQAGGRILARPRAARQMPEFAQMQRGDGGRSGGSGG